ncbi:hypothetical protein BABAYKA_00510 [Brevundimonas phage vB_BpoS-Babayka]|uniref:Uncharacterized protein n=1 Tax=Brevundimonas phage vB_BpoS-Babayka TaxID=2948596 RepID=A0A9E7SML9_9CAUD|nr:hypothetical protein BABAYKA_00510 [Brevundimonas phage vB_BpoS-Babayka]
MHPLHDQSWLARYLMDVGVKLTTRRMTGRSTARALRSLADAIENPGRQIPVFDHSDWPDKVGQRQSRYRDAAVAKMAVDFAHRLGLKHIYQKAHEPIIIFEKV